MKKLLLLILLFSALRAGAATQLVCDSVEIRFRVSKSALDPDFADNRRALQRIADSLSTGYADSIYRLRRVLVVGGASPEGSVAVNQRLSERRAASIFDHLRRYGELPEELTTFRFLGRDWRGLRAAVADDPSCPYQQESLDFLDGVIASLDSDTPVPAGTLARLKSLKGGRPYAYMLRHMFPALRASKLYVWYEKVPNPDAPRRRSDLAMRTPDTIRLVTRDTLVVHDTLYVHLPAQCPEKKWFSNVKTNLLLDAAAVPNIGVEYAFNNRWSLGANWAYGWWKNDRRHRYWRVYGGELEARWWFGRGGDDRKPLTGHHLGVYGHYVTYDFEFGHRGQMGGRPGGNLWSRGNYGGGLSYGYALPLRRRLNLDFVLGLGYLGGTYYEYVPDEGCYVWKATKRRNFWGPTKLEVSLVWLIGPGNVNTKKPRLR